MGLNRYAGNGILRLPRTRCTGASLHLALAHARDTGNRLSLCFPIFQPTRPCESLVTGQEDSRIVGPHFVQETGSVKWVLRQTKGFPCVGGRGFVILAHYDRIGGYMEAFPCMYPPFRNCCGCFDGHLFTSLSSHSSQKRERFFICKSIGEPRERLNQFIH